MKLGESGPGRSVGGVDHTCVKTLERRGCPGCLDDALAATMGAKRKPPPMQPYPGGLAAASDHAAKAIVREELREQVGYREQTCHACGQTLRASLPVPRQRSRQELAYAWLFAASSLSLGVAFGCSLFIPGPDLIRARWALAAMLFTFAVTFALGRWHLLRRP